MSILRRGREPARRRTIDVGGVWFLWFHHRYGDAATSADPEGGRWCIPASLTHYWPLDGATPAEERQRALARTHADWCERVVADLDQTHPGIHSHIQHIDVWVWGHGMIRPVPGFIWGEARQVMQQAHGRIVFAHSDMSGISIFEEAFTRGTQAADALLQLIG